MAGYWFGPGAPGSVPVRKLNVEPYAAPELNRTRTWHKYDDAAIEGMLAPQKMSTGQSVLRGMKDAYSIVEPYLPSAETTIPAVLGAAGAANLDASNVREAQRAMDYGQASADKAMAHQLYMSNTSMQRRVEDLKMAGLNPALAYMQGGASTGAGAYIGGQQAERENWIGEGVSSGMSARRQNIEMKTAEAQADYLRAQAQATKLASGAQVASTAIKSAEFLKDNGPGIWNFVKTAGKNLFRFGKWLLL